MRMEANAGSRRATALLVVAIVGAVALRLVGLDRGLWVDEVASIRIASDLSWGALRASEWPPLHAFFLRAWMAGGGSDAWLRLESVGVAFVTLLALAAWLRRRSVTAALVGVLLFGTLPILLRYGQEVRGYGLVVAFTTLAFWALTPPVGASRSRAGCGMAGVALAFGVATHLVGVFSVAAAAVYVCVFDAPKKWVRMPFAELIPVVLPGALVFAGFYFWFLQRIPQPEEWWMPGVSVAWLGETASRLSGFDVLVAALASFGMTLGVARGVVGAGFVGLAGLVTFFGGRVGLACLVSAVAYWSLLVAYSIAATPILYDRTALAGLVPAIGFLALEIGAARRWVRVVSVLLVASASLLFAQQWVSRLATRPQEDWKSVGTLLAESWGDGDLVFVVPPFAAPAVSRYVPESVAASVRPLHIGEAPSVPENTPGAFLVVRLGAHVQRSLDEVRALDQTLARAIGPERGARRYQTLVVTRFSRDPAD